MHTKFFKFTNLKNQGQKALILLNYKYDKITNLFFYIYNLIKYYSIPQNYNQLYNLMHLNYIFTNIYIFLYKYNLITVPVIDETWLKWLGVGAWTFFTTLFVRKKYKEYTYNFNYYNKYKYKNSAYNDFKTFWKVYYKYGGNYQQYLYLKKFFLLNKNLNKKKLLVYDFNINKFSIKLNNYYNLLLNELNTDILMNETNHEYNLFNMFIKHKLDTPFLDNNIAFTFYYFKKNFNQKKLENLSHLISYNYLYQKIKKSTISDLDENELFLNYKNFYKWTMSDNFEKNITDIFGVEGNDPFSTPARIYKKFQKWIDFETLFKNVDLFTIDTLYDYIIKAFTFIKETDVMLSVDIDEISNNTKIQNFEELIEALNNNNIDFFDYKIVKNDFNLTVWLNKKALLDPSFINFLKQIKSTPFDNFNVTENLVNLDLFEEPYLQDQDLLTLFLKERFFYLNYFTLAINSQKYSLGYLLFIYKVLKNKKNYEIYYDNFCNSKLYKYNKVVYKYHQHVFIQLEQLVHCFNGFIQNKANTILTNVNNFDNTNFIKKAKNKMFSKFYRFNYKNYIKVNYQNDYTFFLEHFNRYKSHSNFEKKQINITDVITFDEYLYHDINLFDVYTSIELKKKSVEELLKYYIYEKNEIVNFLELGLYLYDIKGFEQYQQDVFFFFEYKEHKYLNFINAEDVIIDNKIEFQKNYSTLYFHYIIKLFKNMKHYIFNIVIENILFDDAFVYLNYDSSMNEKRQDFIFHVECFMKALKTIIAAKHSYIVNFINYLILHYAKFMEYNEKFDYKLLYSPSILDKCNKEDLYQLEKNLDDIMQVWKHILDKIEESRHFYIDSIKMLKLEKLAEFFDFPMFSKVKGFVLLKEAYYICLEELIIEERALDHAYNISMCLFRTFDKHNNFFRKDVLYQNGIMTRLYFLSVEEWEYIFTIEKINPLILIELYNSKQSFTNSEYWNNTISFLDIVYALSNINEKENAYDTLDEDWNIFFEKISDRDLIIYDLAEKDIFNLNNIFKLYNNTWFNSVSIEDEMILFFSKNSLKYDMDFNIFRKIEKDVNSESGSLQEEDLEDVLNDINNDTIVKKEINKNFSNNRLDKFLKDKIIYLNQENDDMSLLCNIMDKKHSIVKESSNFFNYLESKINKFQESNFKNFLLEFFKKLNIEYQDYTYLDNYKQYQDSLNDLFYLTIFYDNINQINKLDMLSIVQINNQIINNEFNYLDKNINFINLSYINLMVKTINKTDLEKSWSESLSKGFNNRFLFLYYNASTYLLNISNILDKKTMHKKWGSEINFNYLPNLNIYINKCNYNNDVIYNIYDLNFINTFDSLFDALNVHILKANYMLNQFNTFKQVIIDVYLKYYDVNKINILRDLYFFLYKNTQSTDKFKYLALINLLLYVKDPIYLYNILICDLKIYIQNIISILDIIHKPESHNDTYDSFLEFLMYKHKTLIEGWTQPLKHKGWSFSLYNTDRYNIKQKKIDKINVSYFFSYATVINLNNSISNLDQYNGFFNLDKFNIETLNQNYFNFDEEFNILEMFNINKLLYNFDHLFSINNVKGLRLYSLKEFILYNESNNFESFYICSNYRMYLTYMLKQSCKYDFYFNNGKTSDFKKNEEYKDLKAKDYETLIGIKKKVKNLRRQSAPSIFKKKPKKTKIIKILVKTELQPEDFKDYGADESTDDEYQNDEYGTDVHYKYANIEVTDSEDSIDDNAILINKKIDKKKKENRNLLEIKNNVVSNVHKNFRQWASDLEFRKAYFNCKDVFNTVLFDYNHPIWFDHIHMFPDKAKFLRYVNSLDDQDKLSIFNIYWDWTIKEVLDKREKERNKKIKKYWFNRLYHASKQTDPMENIRSNEYLDIFCTNIKENEKWKKRWHHDMYFLDMHRGVPGRESDWRAIEHWKEGHFREPDLNERQRGSFERNIFKKQEDQFELWDKTNWWRKW